MSNSSQKPSKRPTTSKRKQSSTNLPSSKTKRLEGHLFSASDIKECREALIAKQQGIDPILKEPFKEVVAVDHDHLTQRVRAALNRNTNAFEGLVANAYLRCLSWLTEQSLSAILRNLADYLEQDYSNNPYHPAWLKNCSVRFNKLRSKQQEYILHKLSLELGLEYTAARNLKERKQLLSKLLLTREITYDKMLVLFDAASYIE